MSVRNNEERLGTKRPDVASPVEQLNENNSFSFVTPTEFVDLPSEGKFYLEDSSLYNVDSIEIRYMTAKDEDILTSKTLLKKGIAIDRLLQNIIVDKNIKVDDLLIGDKNALIVAARITGYGEDYEVSITCPVCSTSNEHNILLSELNTNTISDNLLKEFDVTRTEKCTFLVKLPKSGVNVQLRLLTGKDEKSLTEVEGRRKKHKLPEAALTDQFKTFIISVNGNEEKNIISSFVDSMPAYDSRYLRNLYSNLTPNIDMEQVISCPECANISEVNVPFTVQFFWPK
jgi:hypothetical protein